MCICVQAGRQASGYVGVGASCAHDGYACTYVWGGGGRGYYCALHMQPPCFPHGRMQAHAGARDVEHVPAGGHAGHVMMRIAEANAQVRQCAVMR